MYYILYGIMLILCSMKLSNNKRIYRMVWLLLTAMLVLRYGQGTDYINYNYHFQAIGRMSTINNVAYYGLDLGYMLINKLFYMTGLSFQWFIACLSIFMMVSLDRYISKHSNKPVLSLLLFYPTYFLTYYSSAIAQGIVLALFLGYMLDLLLQKRIVPYVILCLVASTIHLSGLVLFLGLLIHVNHEKTYKYMLIFSFALSLAGIALGSRISYVQGYYGAPRLISILEKVIWLICLIYLSRRIEVDQENQNILKLYYTGFIIAIVFVMFPTVSSRICVYYKALEVGLFASLLYKYQGEDVAGKAKVIFRYAGVSLIIIALTTSMFYKNINQYLANGRYYDTSFFAYKYISLFERDKLYQYRDSVFRGMID